ncbi:MAG: glycosyltransferase family 4 protein [Deltaproteobacteria bacterium]|nr:glycosyltransferase family 4 protein [Deltaproteobacteria bacterium]
MHAKSLEERPLGGTETALIRVAEILQQRGHEVTVFTSHRNPPCGPGPAYYHLSELQKHPSCDVSIAVQDWWGVFYPIECRKRFYWTGDASDQYMNFGLGDKRIISRIDLLLGVSNWHVQNICGASGFPVEKSHVIRNGVHLPWFEGQEERSPRRLIFTSAPYRGLDLAVGFFRELKKSFEDLELHVFAGFDLYDRERPFEGAEKQQFERTKRLCAEVPGVVLHGNLRQRDLAREYMKSGLFFYPVLIPETFCITAIEAQAAGCPVLSSALGGLPETVGDGGLVIHGAPGSKEYNHAFLEGARLMLSDRGVWQRFSEQGQRRARAEFSWEHVVDRLEAALQSVG